MVPQSQDGSYRKQRLFVIEVRKKRERRVCQGDIFREVDHIESVAEKDGVFEVKRIRFPLVIVLTQDCDLVQDYRVRWSREQPKDQDKMLVSVLVAPLYNVEHVYTGDHLSLLGMQMQKINKNRSPGINLRSNQTPRYHFLAFPDDTPIVDSVIDFKHYFSVSVEKLKTLKKINFVRRIAELYREDISQRFVSYLSRIGLP